MKRVLKRLSKLVLTVSVSFLVAGLLGEVLIRVTIKDQIVLYPRYHTDVNYGKYRIRRFRPNSVFTHTSVDGEWKFSINDQGFRSDRNYEYEKPNNVIRVLALGDSHTAGYEVAQDESYTAVLEGLLQGSGLNAEVMNTGISGFGTAEQLVFLENEGMRYAPDVVIVGFYANDLQDNVKSGLYSLQDGALVAEKFDHAPGVDIQNTLNDYAVIRWLSENSYFFSFTFNAIYEIAKSVLSESAKKNAVTEYAIPVGEFTDYEFSLAVALIERISKICSENGALLLILDIPAPSKDKRIVPSISKVLRDDFRENSTLLIDSRTTLAELLTNDEPVHVPHGHQHISRFSHRLFAEKLAIEIEALVSQDDEVGFFNQPPISH